MLNRNERNRVLTYAKNAWKKQTVVSKLLAKKEQAIKKTEERYDKMIEDSLDYKEYKMNLEMVRVILKNPDITLDQVITEKVSQKMIMDNMCNTRTYQPTPFFLEKYCGITPEEAETESAPSMEAEAAEEIAAEVDEEVEAEEETESTDSASEIPEELNDDF